MTEENGLERVFNSRLEYAVHEAIEMTRTAWDLSTSATYSPKLSERVAGHLLKIFSPPVEMVISFLAIPMLMGGVEYSEEKRGYVGYHEESIVEYVERIMREK